jgi:hypothetical protein
MRCTIRAVENGLWCVAWGLLGSAVALSLSPDGAGVRFGSSDKVLHSAGYGALALSLLLAAVWFPGRGRGRLANQAVLLISAVIGLSLVLEVLQGFVGRDADTLDAGANLLGSVGGYGIWRLLRTTDRRGRNGRDPPRGHARKGVNGVDQIVADGAYRAFRDDHGANWTQSASLTHRT